MSDDERMDRAKRIRNLREGRRGGDRSGTDRDSSSTAEIDGDTEPDEDGSPPAPGNAGPESDDTNERLQSTPSEVPAGDGASEPTAPADGTSVGAEPGTVSETAEAESAEQRGPEDEDGALAAAAAAAQAASEFESTAVTNVEDESLESAPGSEDSGAMDSGDDEPPAVTDDVPALENDDSPDGTDAGPDSEDEETPDSEDVDRDTSSERTRVLEFKLGEERYCLDIEYVEEIVRDEAVTRVPNTPEYVSGVVDLRGQITTILDPKTTIGIDDDGEEQLIVVFDDETFDDHGSIGWLVDEVDRVLPITQSEVKASPIQESYINGIVEDDGDFVIWTTPELALDVDEA